MSTPKIEATTVVEPSVCILHVCTSCRAPGSPREPLEDRPGYQLFLRLSEAVAFSPLSTQVTVAPAECLSICPRPCGIALSASNAWTYLFGDQNPAESPDEILRCLQLYLVSRDGFMRRKDRPKSLRNSILGRVPTITRLTPPIP